MNLVPLKQLDHIDQFLNSFTSKHTKVAYQRDLNEYSEFSQGSDPFSFSTLVLYRNDLISRSAPATVVRKFSAVKSFMAFLASQGAIGTNPAQNLKVPKGRTLEHTEAFSDAEVLSMLSLPNVKTFQGNWHRLALQLLFNLGIRCSELVNLRLSSLAEHRGTHFISIIGKGDKPRLIPLTQLMLKEIEAYGKAYTALTGRILESQDFLLQTELLSKNVNPVNTSTIYRLVRKYAEEAGISKRVSPHSCRATMISHLLEKNVSPRAVADIAGHSSISTTVGIYDKKRDALSNPAIHKIDYGSQKA